MKKQICVPINDSPRRLTTEEINDPGLVLKEFFWENDIPGCRRQLRDWLYAGLAGESSSVGGNPANLFSFYERVEKLIEAAYLINSRYKLK